MRFEYLGVLKKLVIFISLFVFLFFGEIAMTFSDKGYPSLLNDEEVPFSLLLDNSYSDYQSTGNIDKEVSSFIKRWKIEGASLAVTKDERLVYAKGFGIANSETGEEVKPGHLFRIASVSKLITAVAVMKLYEEGQLGLDDPVFGELLAHVEQRGMFVQIVFRMEDPRTQHPMVQVPDVAAASLTENVRAHADLFFILLARKQES